MQTRGKAAGPAVIDVPYLATTFAFPENEVQSLLDAPTADLVKSFLRSLSVKGQEFDALKAETLKLDVELENNVRTSEAKVKAQKATVTKQAKEIEELRKQLSDAENTRDTLASELEQLRAASSGSSAETVTLRQRIDSLEASNRDALALVETKSAEKDCLAVELTEQHSKLLTLRREISQLEEKKQSLENAASSQKFKEQSMQQEIDMLKRNNEWTSNELQTRNQEHAKFRKERNAHVASLQRELEDSMSSVEALRRTETGLRQRLEELQAKADEAFARIANLQEEFTRKEQDFKAELDSTRRLAELQAQNAATHKARLQDVQNQIEEQRDQASEEIGRLYAEIETERSDKLQAEGRTAELELTVERLERLPRSSRQATPVRNGDGDPRTLSRALSPSALPGSMRKSVGGLSFTQLYSQYTSVKEELENEQRRTHKLTVTLDDLLNDIESKTPQLTELSEEKERLEGEIVSFTHLLDEAKETRDSAIKESERWQAQAAAAAREGEVLRQQLRDLSAQIKILLVESHGREQGLSDMTAQERLELERAARGELDGAALDNLTSTGRLISERLVIFRDVSDLQAKNEDLLRITRQLGEQMEGEEAREKARQSAEYAEENQELKRSIGRYKDELQATATQINSYMKERDMFRRMLQHRGQLPADADMQSMFGQSIGPVTPARNGSMPPPTPRSKDVEDLNKLLKEQQTFFDQYRNETSTDRRLLKEQVDMLAREKSTLQADVARAQSQLTLASERFEMLQANYAALRSENSELQKRSQQLGENAAKQDLRTQQVAEELVEARSLADSLRNENAHAKAEKDLWKRIEARLTEDNKGLMDERSRLNKLVTDLQNLQNERELAESENRRRTQARIDTLEAELSETKKKLESEADDGRKAASRREFEEHQSRTRIDDLVKSLGNVREELVAAKTTRDQLQARVEELKIELRSAEEKLSALQPRPTPRVEARSDGEPNGDASEIPDEQSLAIQVSDLRRDLELARNELDSARQQIEQYKAIAQSSEEELAAFNETSEQFKDEMDRVIAEKDALVKQLEQRVEDLSSELTTTNAEMSALRARADDHERVLNEHQANFESELSRLKDDAERSIEEKKFFQQDLKAQAEIAQQAQQAYEDELLKHAEAARSLQAVRKEYNDLRTEVASVRAEADAAKASLEQGEESWSEQKERFERELEEAHARRLDVDSQNKLLHQQMESFSSELSMLRAGRSTTAASGEDSSHSTADGNSLQEVIKYLRREKEIIDVQYELSIQDSKRLQQQLDYANNQLEDTRQKLAEERRLSADKSANEGSTTKLMQTINELNLFRESATTLRNEARAAREKLEQRTLEVERLVGEMEPLKSKTADLEADVETKDGELKLITQDRDHWRDRTQNIISKYDRVDPAELEEMKKQLEAIKADKDRLEAERAPLQEEIDGFEAKITQAKDEATTALVDRLTKFKEQAKEQNRKQNEKVRQLNEELAAAKTELANAQTALGEALAALQKAQTGATIAAAEDGQLQTIRTELEQTRTLLTEAQTQLEAAKTDGDEEDGQINEDGPEKSSLRDQLAQATTQASEQSARAEALSTEVQTLQGQVQTLESQVSKLEQQLEIANTVDGEPGEVSMASGTYGTTLEDLKKELASAQEEVQTLRAGANSAEDVASTERAQPLNDDVASEVAKLRAEMEEQHQLAIRQMQEEHEGKVEKMKANLVRQLKDERERIRGMVEQELATKHSDELDKLRNEHEAAVSKLKEDHAAELQRLAQDGAKAQQNTVVEGAPSGGSPEISDAQMLELVKTNARMKQIVANNIRKQVTVETEKFNKLIEEKDTEIAALKEAQTSATSDADREALQQQLDAAKLDKENAIKSAVNSAEMKTKVQLSQLEGLRFKWTLVGKAAEQTPTKAVKEVYDTVKTARPPPKPQANPAAVASPSATAKATVPTSPTPAQAQDPGSPVSQTPEQIEQAKLRARQERFNLPGTGGSETRPASRQNTFGQPSALPQPARRMSTAVDGGLAGAGTNPNAPSFTPVSGARSATGIPRGGAQAGSRTSSIGVRGGAAIQGAARGGGAQPSGLPRGGGNIARGRGGAGGIPRAGGAQNAGQKRTNDGSGGGDDKRQKGTGATEGGS